MNNNPSPGNKLGGLTTILEKSLGAAAKGGTTALTAVYEYAEPVTEKGFVFMDTPGFDPVSATGQVAGGANMLAFTTGRGSAYGCKPVPSIKLATNTPMYEKHAARTWTSIAATSSTACRLAEKGERDFRRGARGCFRQEVEVGSAGLWRQRVRALAGRRGDVAQPDWMASFRIVEVAPSR